MGSPKAAAPNISDNASKNFGHGFENSNSDKHGDAAAGFTGSKEQAHLKSLEAIQSEAANSTGSVNNICEDSFQKLYSKELDIDEGKSSL